MTDLLQRVEKNILSCCLLKRGRAVLVAVSGGLDSMVMLRIFQTLSERHGWKLTVAHFNHQLRGRSSDADERLVRSTAAALDLPFVVARADVRQFAKKSKLSIEMAARKLRHEFLARVASERKISVIALAHHADDQVELFFLRVLRGSGGEGLAGMKWRSPSPVDCKITLVRPLLNVTKTELGTFAKADRIRFHDDATNARLDLARNRVRHELLPLLRRHYQPALTKTVLRLMEIVGAGADFVTEAARQWLKQPGALMPQRAAPAFGSLPVPVQRRALQLQLVKLGIAADFELVEHLRRSADTFASVSIDCSVARDAAGRLRLRSLTPIRFKECELMVHLGVEAGKVKFGGTRLRWNVECGTKAKPSANQKGREVFDADKVGGEIILRHWRKGDRFQAIGSKSAAKLQDFFTNQKIPRAQRHELIVAQTATGEIFWVQNLRMAEHFKLTPETRRRLVWHWRSSSR